MRAQMTKMGPPLAPTLPALPSAPALLHPSSRRRRPHPRSRQELGMLHLSLCYKILFYF